MRALQWAAFTIAGTLAGVAGALFAFSKGSISPEVLSVPRSVDALVMVLLGGVQTLTGPLWGAGLFTWLEDSVSREIEYWRAAIGAVIVLLVLAFPQGIAGFVKEKLADECARSARAVQGLRRRAGGEATCPSTLEPSEVVALIGPNGAGKTTCFNLLNGQLAPDAGEILVGKASVAGLPPHRICAPRRRAARSRSRDVRLDERARERAGRASFAPPWVRIAPFGCAEAPSSTKRRRCSSASACASQAERPCAVLAYGDLKRVELAAALAGRPRLLLMDEPTAGMAPEERSALMQLAAEVARSDKIAVLFTEHDMSVVFGYADARHRAAPGRNHRFGHARRGARRPQGARGLPWRCLKRAA